ncbi:hypothetical protein [Qipengyuania qiaonensis]|uniref:Uncharacterized protein n=1 Tax=Qipengyuania qiaonensis TaxID=2867240 RepID=A0ABS7J678_9SPHN|nr:hypothetical protein [Qipengyuania qiaonensis]MBX7482822.1 hypothetical protein [Qipengyuania qiaonensis]
MAKRGRTNRDETSPIEGATGDKLERAADPADRRNGKVAGPSTNPATNFIIHDIVLRSAGRLSRMAVEKALLGRQYGTEFAKDAVENRSVLHTLATYGVTKVATRSLPGALIVGTGIALKVLFDRSQSKRKARRDGYRALRKQAQRDDAN